MLLLLLLAAAEPQVMWVAVADAPLSMLTPVRIERVEGNKAIVNPATLVLEVDERGRIRPLPPSAFSNERVTLPLDSLAPEPPTKTALRARAVSENDPEKKRALLRRALVLDPLDEMLAEEAGEMPVLTTARVVRADLVYGCRGDLTRAQVVDGDVGLASTAADVCAARVDVRPPCAPDVDDGGLAADDVAALRAAAQERYEAARALHARKRARLASFAAFGPGLRLVVEGGGSLWLTTSLLSLEHCECDESVARSLGDERRRIVLPPLTRPALVYVKVPRYVGAHHRLGVARPEPLGAVTFREPFSAEPDDERSGLEVFSAPEGCDCAECGW